MKRRIFRSSLLILLAAFAVWLARSGTAQEEAKSALVGDGKTDNTDALQKLINSGSVHLPRGVYRISKPIVIDLDKTGYVGISGDGTAQILMAGPGPALKFVGTHAGTAAPASFKPEVWNRQRSPMVDGIEIVGANAEADGIEAEGTMQLTITRTVIRQCRHGVHLVKRNRNFLISASHIYQNTGIGIYYDNVNLHQSNIDGCHISYCDGGGFVSRGGEVRNVQIGTCDIESNMSATGASTANVLLDCTGGSIAEVAITGCTIQHNDKGKDSANIRILGRGTGIKTEFARWGHVTITGNVLSDVQHNIDIDNARGITITGNTFWMAYQNNLRVTNSEQIVVGSNMFERNPAYDYGTSLKCQNAIVFRDCKDCTLSAFHVHNIYGVDAAVTVEKCDRFNMLGLTILDCECPTALLLKDVTTSRLSDCLIQNQPSKIRRVSLKVTGGHGNQLSGNLIGDPVEIDPKSLVESK